MRYLKGGEWKDENGGGISSYHNLKVMFSGHDLVVTGLRLSPRHWVTSEKLAKGRNGLIEGRVGSDAARWKAATQWFVLN